MTRVGVAMLSGVASLRADGTGPFTGHAAAPAVDSWMYPHAGSPGTRTTASTFSALPIAGGVDDRFAQFLIKFDTVAAGIPAGMGAANYDPSQVVLTCVLAAGGIACDPTEDPRSSYGSGASADMDSGRPIEVHGAGFRGTFSASTYTENSPFGSSAPGGRNAYALGYLPSGEARDVSHNVTNGFDAIPWAVARIEVLPDGANEWCELAPGSIIPVYAHAVFELNLTLPGVADHVRNSLNQGFIWLTVSSLHSVTEMASSGYPSFFTKENSEQALFGDVAASLDVSYSLPVRVISFSRDDLAKTASISWNASPGFKYTVLASETMAAGTWSPVTSYAPATAGTLDWTGSSISPRTFFRIARTPFP